jgi:hypothetical protein
VKRTKEETKKMEIKEKKKRKGRNEKEIANKNEYGLARLGRVCRQSAR